MSVLSKTVFYKDPLLNRVLATTKPCSKTSNSVHRKCLQGGKKQKFKHKPKVTKSFLM